MWPWGHAAVGYLVVTLVARMRTGRAPSDRVALAVALGTQLPDLVDKPLAWSVPVLPTGRSLAHSFLVALPLLLVLWVVFDEHRPVVGVLGIGWISHSLADLFPSFLAGDWPYTVFVLWPVLSTPPYGTEKSFVAHLAALDLSPYMWLQLVLTGVALFVWSRDGYPGIRVVTTSLRRSYRAWVGSK